MPTPLSNDLRERIIAARERGDSLEKIGKEKGVSASAVTRIYWLYQETGSYNPRPLNNGRKPRLTEEQLEEVRAKILEQPDISLMELIEELQLPLCESALCRIVNKKLELRRKKNGTRGRAEPSGCEGEAERVEGISRDG